MIGLRSFGEFGLARSQRLACAASVSLAPARAGGVDPATMSADEIKALEQRLTDAGCYKGAIDGATEPRARRRDQGLPRPAPVPAHRDRHAYCARSDRIASTPPAARLRLPRTTNGALWSLPDGKLKRVIRLPIGDGDAGKVYAAALSPDGRPRRWRMGRGRGARPGSTASRSSTLRTAYPAPWPVRGRHRPNRVFSRWAAYRRWATGREWRARARQRDGSRTARRSRLWRRCLRPRFRARRRADHIELGRNCAATGPTSNWRSSAPHPTACVPMASRSTRRAGASQWAISDDNAVSILDAKTLAPLAKAQTGDLGNGDLLDGRLVPRWRDLVAGGLRRLYFNAPLPTPVRRRRQRKGEDSSRAQLNWV